MQPGDTSFSDETTGVLLFDEWTPTSAPDFFADDNTTTTWISVSTTWDDADEATRRLQSQDAANMLSRMAAPQVAWDSDDSTTQTWSHQHIATLSSAVFRTPARTLDIPGPSAADLASARLRARARSAPAVARPTAAAIPHAPALSEADLASSRLRARARASQPAFDAQPASVRTAAASQRMPTALATDARASEAPAVAPQREQIRSATSTLRSIPFVAHAQVSQPVAPRLTMRVAPLVELPTNKVEVAADTWLAPRTQWQFGMMSLIPGVALFAAVFVARVLLAAAGPALSSSPTLSSAPIEQAAPLQQAAPRAVQQAPEPPAAAVPPEQAAAKTKASHVHHEHVKAEQVASAALTPSDRDVAPRASQRSVSATLPASSASPTTQGEGVLRINSRPWAEVFVDGALVGHTPQPNLHLSAGAHKVELINRPMSMSKTLRVQIRPGQTETQIINLIE